MFDEINNFVKMRSYRRQFALIQFPIARRTTICVSEHRILLWKQSALFATHRFLGSVDRSRVKTTELERSTHVKWKVITINLREGQKLRFLIDHESAGALANELTVNEQQ